MRKINSVIKKKICKFGLFIACNILTHLPCWNWSSRLIDRLIVATEGE